MEGPSLGPGGEDITWRNQVAPRGRKASSTRKIKPQTSNPSQSSKSSKNRIWIELMNSFEIQSITKRAADRQSRLKYKDSIANGYKK